LVATAHVWIVPVAETSTSIARARSRLSHDERLAADRFVFEPDRVRYTVAHAALRVLLARSLARLPGDLRFDRTSRGKPYLADADVQFNLSHSGRYSLVGICRDGEIGVDTELMRTTADYRELADRYFAPQESAWIETAPLDEQLVRFYRLWTVKEAFLKASGVGLSKPLSEVVVDFLPARGAVLASERGWTVDESVMMPGHAAAAVVRTGVTVRWHRYEDEVEPGF
jgi:4'-phosphopantetheinyl transferase